MNIQKINYIHRQNQNSTYIKIIIKNNGRETEAYIDTGAICIATKTLFDKWEKVRNPARVSIADGSVHSLGWIAKKTTLIIENKLFIIPIRVKGYFSP